jgi:hypothetical protein
VLSVLFKSIVYGPASGSIAGLTYSHNAGGQYTRARATPVNSNTIQQQAVRAIFAQLATLWTTSLTQAQRDGWAAYAAAVSVPNPFGDPIFLGPLSWYQKVNTPRLQALKTRLDAAPTILTLTPLTAPTFTVAAATDLASVSFTNTDPWAIAVGGFLFAYFSLGQNVTINYFKGPYRFAAAVIGAVVPPTSPASIALPFAVVAGQKVFGRFAASDSTGRPSVNVRTSSIAV